MIHHGDCLDVMATMEPDTFDAIVTDPPYNLGFMGKAWDMRHQHEPWAREAYRVAKPSAYLLAFGGTRTVHRLACAIEDAGWIIRDLLVWGYASGFPKSKASLKPAWEPIVMARKPGPLRDLAIDECRIGVEGGTTRSHQAEFQHEAVAGQVHATRGYRTGHDIVPVDGGRWPANILLTDPIFDGGWDGVVGGGEAAYSSGYESTRSQHGYDGGWKKRGDGMQVGYGDSGTYSRFFIIPKADRSDREPVMGGLPLGPRRTEREFVGTDGAYAQGRDPRTGERSGNIIAQRANVHPTVKPTDLMRHLVRLVTPQGGTVLDPFLGSGTTGLACEMEGFGWVGIEKEAEYVAIAEARLHGIPRGMGL